MASLAPEEIQSQLKRQHENKDADIIASLTIMLTVAYVAVALRLTSRRLMHTTLGADDWMMVLGLVSQVSARSRTYGSDQMAALDDVLYSRMLRLWVTCDPLIKCETVVVNSKTSGVSLGMGKHAVLLTKPVAFAQATLSTEVLYTPASTSIKFSVLLLYRRLFPNKRLKIASYCIGVFLIIFALAQMLSVIFQCTPVAALWDPFSHPGASCDNYRPALILFAAVNALTDIIILCLPLPILWHLHTTKTRRRQLIGVFLLGGL